MRVTAALKRIVKSVCAQYVIVIQWEDKSMLHYAWDWNEAKEWLECYKVGVLIEVRTNHSMTLIASREQIEIY